jgi:hypothetical protein
VEGSPRWQSIPPAVVARVQARRNEPGPFIGAAGDRDPTRP